MPQRVRRRRRRFVLRPNLCCVTGKQVSAEMRHRKKEVKKEKELADLEEFLEFYELSEILPTLVRYSNGVVLTCCS